MVVTRSSMRCAKCKCCLGNRDSIIKKYRDVITEYLNEEHKKHIATLCSTCILEKLRNLIPDFDYHIVTDEDKSAAKFTFVPESSRFAHSPELLGNELKTASIYPDISQNIYPKINQNLYPEGSTQSLDSDHLEPWWNSVLKITNFYKFAIAAILIPVILNLLFHFVYLNVISVEQKAPSHNISWNQVVREMMTDINQQKNQFKSQNADLWHDVLYGLKDYIEKPNLAVYLLLHNNNTKTASCITQSMISLINKHITGNVGGGNWLLLNGTKMSKTQNHDYGILLDKIATKIKEHHILVVIDVQDIPAHLAMVFHNLCDHYNPMVKETIIIFTANTGNSMDASKPMHTAEHVLKERWKDLEPDILNPLITRVTSIPLVIMQETNIQECLLNSKEIEF